MWPNKILLTEPIGFKVVYSINPHMRDQNGELNRVDENEAMSQWLRLKALLEEIGLEVHTIPGSEAYPDMVFCANQTFPFIKPSGEAAVLLSQMHSGHRQGEVAHYEAWAHVRGLNTFQLKDHSFFEGMGDALWNYETREIFGGYGFRTSEKVYDEIEDLVQAPVHRLKLVDERFYHLDTCLAIINKSTAFVVEEAFEQKGIELLKTKFSNLISIPLDEAINQFAGNMLCVNGRDVIIQKGASNTVKALKGLDLKVHEIDTSEFIKSGGSVFCMKQLFF
jgi:N-dimethylarginine dimethylaminohydrolase